MTHELHPAWPTIPVRPDTLIPNISGKARGVSALLCSLLLHTTPSSSEVCSSSDLFNSFVYQILRITPNDDLPPTVLTLIPAWALGLTYIATKRHRNRNMLNFADLYFTDLVRCRRRLRCLVSFKVKQICGGERFGDSQSKRSDFDRLHINADFPYAIWRRDCPC